MIGLSCCPQLIKDNSAKKPADRMSKKEKWTSFDAQDSGGEGRGGGGGNIPNQLSNI